MSAALVTSLGLAVHVIGGGVWIGAVAFNVFILHPRAEKFFQRSAEFEDFLFSVVHGARYLVLAGVAAIVASGAWLTARYAGAATPWSSLVAAKIALLLASLGLFLYVSFVLWPRRVFATEAELPAVRRRFWVVGVAMILCNTANMGAGLLAHVLRAP
jgi:uncharacterized membrane protein